MSYTTILAIDLGKFKSVLCVMDVATRTHRFLTVESTPELMRQAVQQHCSTDPTQTQVVFETCAAVGPPCVFIWRESHALLGRER